MDTIRVIGLGVGNLSDLSVKTNKLFKEGVPTYFRTFSHSIYKELISIGQNVVTFDEIFQGCEDFNNIYNIIVEKIVAEAKEYGKINYCVPGSPLYGDKVTNLLKEKYSDKINIVLYDAESFLDKCIKLSGYTNYNNIKIIDVINIDEFSFDVNALNIIPQIDNIAIASDLKIKLMEVYNDSHQVIIIDVLTDNTKKIPLFLLDREINYEFSTYICILPIETCDKPLYNIENLCRLVKILRGPDGCPWDIKQTHESCKNCLIEETQEVIDAINNKDYDNLCEELGDVLFQVIFHSEIASEEGYFGISDVMTGLYEKMVRRHPHVFGEVKACSSDEAKLIWNNQKEKEKN